MFDKLFILFAPLLVMTACFGEAKLDFPALPADAIPPSGPPDLDYSGQHAAYAVVAQHCMSCHQHQNWKTLRNDTAWVNQGLVVPGDLEASNIMSRMKHGAGELLPANKVMPEGITSELYKNFSKEKYDIVADWILHMDISGAGVTVRTWRLMEPKNQF